VAKIYPNLIKSALHQLPNLFKEKKKYNDSKRSKTGETSNKSKLFGILAGGMGSLAILSFGYSYVAAADGEEKSGNQDYKALIKERIKIVAEKLQMKEADVLEKLPHFIPNRGIFVWHPPSELRHIENTIDHTLLKPNATSVEIKKLCHEANQFEFAAVCVNGYWAVTAKEALKSMYPKSSTKVAAVIGFPLGASTTASKAFETADLIKLGVDEIDMVLNIGCLVGGEYETVLSDIKSVVQAADQHPVKVIFETGLLKKEQIIDASIISVLAGANYIKTSTGFGNGGAKLEDVKLMKAVVGHKALVKASGGVRTFEEATAMINAGASRIGTSSGIAIIQGGIPKENY